MTEKFRVVVTQEEDSRAATWELFVHHEGEVFPLRHSPRTRYVFCGKRSHRDKQRSSRVARFKTEERDSREATRGFVLFVHHERRGVFIARPYSPP